MQMSKPTSRGLCHARMLALACAAWLGLAHAPAQAQQCAARTPIFADEFNGTAVDTTKWEVMVGDGCSYGLCGWGNNELQSYQAANATVAGGLLTITAKKERIGSKNYTSARLRTLNRGGQWKNGRFEARIKTNATQGLWPAFWMLPATTVPWPASGEIDIQESTGQRAMFNYGTIHYGPSTTSHQQLSSGVYTQPGTWAEGFHTYAVEWTPNRIDWFINDVLYATATPSQMANPADWTFENYAYYLTLNLAVGGNLGGTVNAAALPQSIQVDYVRVYAAQQPSLTGRLLVEPNSTVNYAVVNRGGNNPSYLWTLPNGQTATTSSVNYAWGTTGGPVSVTVTDSCGSYSKTIDVKVSPVLYKNLTLDDFEATRTLNLSYTTVTGQFTPSAANPVTNDPVNSSSRVASYARNTSQPYDLIMATTAAIPDAGPYLKGTKAVYLDVYTQAPVGTPILVQFEDNRVATATNYPLGRHSKYIARTQVQGAWQRLKFVLEDRISDATANTAVNQIVLMFNPNTATGDTYYLDNFALYGDTAPATTMRVSSVVNGTASAGGGKKFATATVTVVNNNGAPVVGATVTGNFTGTITQSGVSGVTGSAGTVTLRTSTSASGTITNSFCVSQVSLSGLTLDAAGSVGMCR